MAAIAPGSSSTWTWADGAHRAAGRQRRGDGPAERARLPGAGKRAAREVARLRANLERGRAARRAGRGGLVRDRHRPDRRIAAAGDERAPGPRARDAAARVATSLPR